MELSRILIEHRLLIETIYLFAIVLPAFYVFLTTSKLYRFSRHRGLKYFSLAFLFFAVGYAVRFMAMLNVLYVSGNNQTLDATFSFLVLVMEIVILMPGFFLLYSLVWRKIHTKYLIPVYLVFALAISIIDFLSGSFLLMYITQVAIFLVASVISFKNYLARKKPFRLTMFVIMVLFLLVWIINFIGQYTIADSPIIRLPVYIMTVVIALSFLIIVRRLTKKF